MFDNILLEMEGTIAVLTINRPDKRNAVNNQTVEELDAALDSIEKNRELRVLILTGAGEKAFVAGADLNELKLRDTILGRTETRRRQEVYTRIEQLEIPSIAAVNGWALGTGLELALCCTLRIASARAKMGRAKMGQPEVRLGITPGAGGTQRLPRLIGMGRAMEMILTGDPVDADQALVMGLVNRVCPPEDLMKTVREVADAITDRPKLAVQYCKEAVLRYSQGSLSEGLAHESYLHALSCGTADKKEGVAAFFEKRPPKFTGK
jgi:enoyl-CoA hydratase